LAVVICGTKRRSMKVLAKRYKKAFFMKHCFICGKITETEEIVTHTPGIALKECPICKIQFKCIWVGPDSETLSLPDHFILPSDKEIEEFYSTGNYVYYPE